MDDVRQECSECHQKYDKGKRCPRSLFCGHTFCTTCLERVISGGTRRCPTCSRPFIALTAAQLPTDFTLLKGITSSAPSTTSLRTSDHFSHESKSGISAATASSRTTSSSSQDLKSSTSPTGTKSFQLPMIRTNATNFSFLDSKSTSESASSRFYSSGSRSKLRLSEDPKEASSLTDRKTKDDVDSPRSTTFLRYNSEELRESRPYSSLSYEFPTITTRFSTGNRESRTSQSSIASGNTAAQRAEDLATTSESPTNETPDTSTETRRSGFSHRFYTSRDELLTKTTPTTLESESKLTQSRPTGLIQLPLTSGVSRLLSQEQRPSGSGSTQLNPSSSSFKSPTPTDPHVSTSSFNKLPRLSKTDTTLRSSVSDVSSNTKTQVDEVDRSISSREREEESSVRRNTGNDAIKSKTMGSNTPSHVLKMCRSITTKSRNVSDNEEESSVASTVPSSSESNARNRENYYPRGLRQDSNESKDDIPASPYGSSGTPGFSRGLRAHLTSSNINRSESNKLIGEHREAMSDNESRDPEPSLQPVSNYYASLTRRENEATQSRTSVPPTGPNETSHQEEVKETSNEKLKTKSFDEENLDITYSHHRGRMVRITDKSKRFDRTLSASLKDLSVSKTETEASGLGSNRTLTRSLSAGPEHYDESESGTSSSASRESGRLARSSTLSARLSARTSFISRPIQEENEENLKENRSVEEKFHDRENELNKADKELRPTNRSSSLSTRLMSRTSFLSRTSSAEEDTHEGLGQGQDGSPGGASSSWRKIRKTKSEDHTTTSSWPDGSFHSVAPGEDKMTRMESHRRSKSNNFDPECKDVTPDSPDTKPSLPSSPPPTSTTTTSSNSICPDPPREGSTIDQEDEAVSGYQAENSEDESTASDGVSWPSDQMNKLSADKISRTGTNPSTDDESGSHSQASPSKYTTVEPNSVNQQERWMHYKSDDSPSEGEEPNVRTSYRTSGHEGFTSQEKSSVLASSSPFTASSWKSRSASSHPSYQSPLVGESQRTAGKDSKSLGPYADSSSQARVTEIDSVMKSRSSLSNNNTGDATPAEGMSGSSRMEERHQGHLSTTDQSPSSRTWHSRSGRSMQDSIRNLDDSSTSTASMTSSEIRPVSPLPQAARDFDTRYSRADTGRHEQRLARSRYSATQESTQRGKLSDPGKEKRIMSHSRICDTNTLSGMDVGTVSSAQSEDNSKETDTEESEDTSHSWRMPGTHREALGHTRTPNVPRRTSQGAALNSTLYGRPLTAGDKMDTQQAKRAKDSASDDQSKNSKSTRDDGVDDPRSGAAANISRHEVTRSNPRLRSSYDFDALQTNTTPAGKNQGTKLSRPVSTNSVQDIWRARNAKNRNYLTARMRQTRSTANEAPGEAETSEADVEARRARYQWPDNLHTDPESGDSKPNSSCLRMSFLRSNLQGKTEVDDESSESVSTFASQHHRLTQSGQRQGDGDGILNVPGVESAPIQEVSHTHSTPAGATDTNDAERADVKPPKQRGSDQDHKYPKSEATEGEGERSFDSLRNDQTETQALARDDMTLTDDQSQRHSFLRSPEPGTDSVDAPHLWKVPNSSNYRLRLTKPTPIETGLDALQTGPSILPADSQQDSNLIYSSTAGNFITEHTSAEQTSLKEEIRDSPQESRRKFGLVDNTKPDLSILTPEAPPGVGSCGTHGFLLHLYCKKCEAWVCDDCLDALHQPPPLGHCEVISAEEAVVHMKMAHSEFLTSKVNALDHFREELSKLLTECDDSTREHEANINQLNLKLQEEVRFLKGIESMRNLALQKMNQIDYWEDLLQQNATRINRSSSSREIFSAVHINRSNILANIMGGLALPESFLDES